MNAGILKLMTQVFGDFKQKLEEGEKENFADRVYTASELKMTSSEIGGKVELINQDGSLSELPDGDYKYEDGHTYSIKGGLIEAIDGEAKKDEAKPEEMSAETPAEESPAEASIEEAEKPNPLQAEVEALRAEIAELKASFAEMKAAQEGSASKEDVNQFGAQVTQLNETILKLAKLPAEFTKTSTNNIIKDKEEEDKNEMVSILANLTKKRK